MADGIPPDELVNEHVNVMISNPFAIGVLKRRKAVRFLLQHQDVLKKQKLGQWLDAGLELGVGQVVKTLLALGHAYILSRKESSLPSEQILFPTHISGQKIWSSLPGWKGRLYQLLRVADEVYTRLNQVIGTSEYSRQVRRETWSACFGRELDKSIILFPILREQNVLIRGETGTGKEMIAQALLAGISIGGSRAPKVSADMSTIPKDLAESRLFGHKKGAFTGANHDLMGHLPQAHEGGLFLDEVGDIDYSVQPKLLRAMEQKEVQPLGSEKWEKADVRFIAATSKNIEDTLDQNMGFRSDLYYRLKGVEIKMPPLRERTDDIKVIGTAYLEEISKNAREKTGFDFSLFEQQSEEVLDFLESQAVQTYHWPGNVRELKGEIRNLLLGLPTGAVGKSRRLVKQESKSVAVPKDIGSGQADLKRVEAWYIQKILQKFDGNKSQAAKSLGVHRDTLGRKLSEGSNREIKQ